MKIRNGFVSNSSSSSFIVGILDPEKKGSCPCCGRPYLTLEHLLNRFSDSVTVNTLTVEELRKDYSSSFSSEIESAISSGISNFAYVDIPHGSTTEDDLKAMAVTGTLKIVARFEG